MQTHKILKSYLKCFHSLQSTHLTTSEDKETLAISSRIGSELPFIISEYQIHTLYSCTEL